ncbi:hypothetical protein ETB97_003067 [Aspergillus alliaceus]|uniref:Fumarylacetoacetase-like C-terminal domain-containing protein n=1 Tax=Petromyces alliaceus TaxID=209559 RepID=A0A8H6EAJ6_PETAA|nr:hypothetical protein ETB97_003067 [Aspergillus burnettii]
MVRDWTMNASWLLLLEMMFLIVIGNSNVAEGNGDQGRASMARHLLVQASSLPKLICDPNALTISTIVNEQIVQSFSTKDMIFGVAETVSFLSQGTTLLPGDLFFTGT